MANARFRQVVSSAGGVAVLESTNGAQFTVNNSSIVLGESTFVEVRGEVESGAISLNETSNIAFGEEFDLDVYGEVCALSQGKFAPLM